MTSSDGRSRSEPIDGGRNGNADGWKGTGGARAGLSGVHAQIRITRGNVIIRLLKAPVGLLESRPPDSTFRPKAALSQ